MKNDKIYAIVLTISLIIVSLIAILLLGTHFSKESTDSLDESSLSVDSEQTTQEKKPSDYDGLQVLSLAETVLRSMDSFYTYSSGYIDTQVLLFNYRQSVEQRRMVASDATFFEWKNSGALLNSGLQVYHTSDTTLLRIGSISDMGAFLWDNDPYSVREDEYLATMGSYFDHMAFYDLSAATVISSSFVSASDGKYIFSFRVNSDAFEKRALFLKTINSFEFTPVFESAEILLEVDSAFRPLSITYDEQYYIQMDLIGETVCHAWSKEVFDYSFYELSENQYFLQYLNMPTDNFPTLPGGYRLLFALFGNDHTYDLFLTWEDECIPFLLTFDATQGGICLQNDTLYFVYTKDRYYFSYDEIYVSADSNALESHLLRSSAPAKQLNNTTYDERSSNLFDDFSVAVQNGMILLRSSNENFDVYVEIDMDTLIIQHASLTTRIFGLLVLAELDLSSQKGCIPSLSMHQDITHSLPALSMLGELTKAGTKYYHLAIEGDFTYSADVTMSIGDELIASVISSNNSLPLDLYLRGDAISFVLPNVKFDGKLEDLKPFFELSGNVDSGQRSATAGKGKSLTVIGSTIIVQFNDSTLEFENDGIRYTANGTSVYLTKNEFGDGPVKTAPHIADTIELTSLYQFIHDSIYVDIIGANSMKCKFTVELDENTYPAEALVSFTEEFFVRVSLNIYGQPIEFVWSNEILYILHSSGTYFVRSEHIDDMYALWGTVARADITVLSESSSEYSTRNITCSENRLCYINGAYTIVLQKEEFSLQTSEVRLIGRDLEFSTEIVSVSIPNINECIDLYMLSLRLEDLLNRNEFSFEGSLESNGVCANIHSLYFQLDTFRQLQMFHLAFSFAETCENKYQIFYDGEYLYFDVNQIKLFAWVDQLLPFASDSVGETSAFYSRTDSYALSGLKSVKFYNDVLTIATVDMIFECAWKNEEPYFITIQSNGGTLTLWFVAAPDIHAPSLDGRVDVSSLGTLVELIIAAVNSGGISFDGDAELELIENVLAKIQLQGEIDYISSKTVLRVLLKKMHSSENYTMSHNLCVAFDNHYDQERFL